MAKKIIWTNKADKIFSLILEFYLERNGSKTYSRKLNQEIKEILDLLLKHPYLGVKTDLDEIRVLIHGNYKIFYTVISQTIIIHFVWDTRQNPDNIRF
jgi:plasmid stabilization system protein ParE